MKLFGLLRGASTHTRTLQRSWRARPAWLAAVRFAITACKTQLSLRRSSTCASRLAWTQTTRVAAYSAGRVCVCNEWIAPLPCAAACAIVFESYAQGDNDARVPPCPFDRDRTLLSQ